MDLEAKYVKRKELDQFLPTTMLGTPVKKQKRKKRLTTGEENVSKKRKASESEVSVSIFFNVLIKFHYYESSDFQVENY